MRPRSAMPDKERKRRSNLVKIVCIEGLVRGSFVKMLRQCGGKGCHCVKGERHESWYLAQSYHGKKRMIYIPKSKEKEIREWVRNYKQSRRLLNEIAHMYWDRVKKEKEDN